MTIEAQSGRPPDPPRRELRESATARRARDGGHALWVAVTAIGVLLGGVGALLGGAAALLPSDADPTPAPTAVADVTPQTNATDECALTVPGGGGSTPTVHPPSAPEGPDQQEHTMSVYQGQHVTAEFPDATVEAIVLEVRGDQALVRQKGTQRAEWIPLRDLR